MSAESFPPGPDGEVLCPSYPDLAPTLRPPTVVSYGLPYEQACRKHVDGFLGARRVYVLASRTLARQTGCVARLEAALGAKHAGTWVGVAAHTPYDGVAAVLRAVRAAQADCLLTLGGGSLTDAAKLVAYALENGAGSVDDLAALAAPFVRSADDADVEAALAGAIPGAAGPRVPLVFVPTTLSGAEYTRFAGATDPRTRMKVQLSHPRMYAALVVLDAALARAATPDWLWLSTGARAVDHCVECLCAPPPSPPGSGERGEAIFERSLRDIARSLLRGARDPADLDARLAAHLACKDATVGLVLGVYPGASHGIGHNLGPLGVGHGQTSCVLLPAVLKYNAARPGADADVDAAARQERVRDVLWSEPEVADVLVLRGLSRGAGGGDLGDAVRALFDELGLPRSLKDVGVGRDKWDQLALNSLEDKCCKMNPVPLTQKAQVLEILEMCSGE